MMNSVPWAAYAAILAGLVPPVVIAVACVGYSVRVRSALSLTLAVAAVGELVVGAFSRFSTLFLLPRIMSPGGFTPLGIFVNGFIFFAGLAFAVVFSVALLLVLRKGAAFRATGFADAVCTRPAGELPPT